MIPRGLYMGLTTRTVGMSVQSAHSSLFSCLPAYYEWSTCWLVFTACVSCSLPSSWEDEGDESRQVVEFVATEETAALAAFPAPVWHLCLQQSSPWVRGHWRQSPQLPSPSSGAPRPTVTAESLALLHEPAGCGWGPRTLRAPPHSFTQGTSRQCGPAYQQGRKSSCHQGEWVVLSVIIRPMMLADTFVHLFCL